MQKINMTQAFGRIAEHWRPKVAAELNEQEVKLVKCQGTFVWHRHDDADELFLVWRGLLRVEFRDGAVELAHGDLLLVQRAWSIVPWPRTRLRCLFSSRLEPETRETSPAKPLRPRSVRSSKGARPQLVKCLTSQ